MTLVDSVTHQLFDAYLAVDWSASGSPKKGKDSIWWCLGIRDQGEMKLRLTSNPSTRSAAHGEIGKALRDLLSAGMRTLVGFDFPYGYPAGFAAALGLENVPPWKATWELLAQTIEDAANNESNRFKAAGALNARISPAPGPFWGMPTNQTGMIAGLAPTQPAYPVHGLSRLRRTEQRQKSAVGSSSPKPTWQLFGAGSVGSQALLGIPRIHALLTDPDLEDHSAVWPFADLTEILDRGGRTKIVHAEIYPSLEKLEPDPASVRDEGQVKAVVRRFARDDDVGKLGELLRVPYELPEPERTRVLTEEGWILGIEKPGALSFTFSA